MCWGDNLIGDVALCATSAFHPKPALERRRHIDPSWKTNPSRKPLFERRAPRKTAVCGPARLRAAMSGVRT
jgi:hypothetical protein